MSVRSQLAELYTTVRMEGVPALVSSIYGLKSQFADLNSSMEKVHATSRKPFSFGGGGIGNAMGGFGFPTAIGAGSVTAVIAGAVKAAADIEGGMARVRQTTGLQGKDLKELEAGLLDIGTNRSGILNKDLMAIAANAGQIGIEGKANILTFTDGVARMAAISDMSAEEVADSFAQILNIFKLAPKDVEALGSAMAQLAVDSVATSRDIADITKRIGGAGATLGMTVSQVMALAAALRDAGVTSEVGGTSVTQLLLKMATAPEAFAKIARMSAHEFKTLMRTNPMEGFTHIVKEIANMGKDGATALDGMGLEGARISATMLQLAQVADKLEKHNVSGAKAWEDQTAMMRQYVAQAGSAWKEVDRLHNSLQRLGAATAEGWLQRGVGAMGSATNATSEVAKATEMGNQMEFGRKQFIARNTQIRMMEEGAKGIVDDVARLAEYRRIQKQYNEQREYLQQMQDLADSNIRAGGMRGFFSKFRGAVGYSNDESELAMTQKKLSQVNTRIFQNARAIADLEAATGLHDDDSSNPGKFFGGIKKEVSNFFTRTGRRVEDRFAALTTLVDAISTETMPEAAQKNRAALLAAKTSADVVEVIGDVMRFAVAGHAKSLMETARNEKRIGDDWDEFQKGVEKDEKEARDKTKDTNAMALRLDEIRGIGGKRDFRAATMGLSDRFRTVQEAALSGGTMSVEEGVKKLVEKQQASADSLDAIKRLIDEGKANFLDGALILKD